MFSPKPEGVERFNGLMNELIGEPATEIDLGIKNGQFDRFSVPVDLRDRANVAFYNALSYRIRLQGDYNLRRFWAARVEDAIGVHTEVKAKFPSLDMDILREVGTPTSDISDTLAVLAAKGHGSLPGHERKTRTLLGIVAAAITADDMAVDMNSEMVRVDQVLLQHFFANEDDTHPYKLHSLHDKRTNTYLTEGGMLIPDGAVRRSFTVQLRDVKDSQPVHYFSGLKPKVSAITKAVSRAVKNGGDIKPEKDVQDRYRVAIARMDSDIDAIEMAKAMRQILNNKYRKVESFDDDHKIDGYSSCCNNKLGWHREKIKFEGVPTPLELAIFDRKSFVNYQVEIGNRDSRTGIYDGNARQFYEVMRMEGLLEVIYPQDLGLYKFSAQRAVADRMEELVPAIRRVGQPSKRYQT